MAHPLELVNDGVLAFLPPMKEEHVPEQLRELGVGIDALAVMELGEQFDVSVSASTAQVICQARRGDAVGVDAKR